MATHNPTDTKEIWKTIPNFPDYEASNFGRVRRAVWRNGAPRLGRILKPGKCGGSRNYLSVALSHNGVIKYLTVHSLIALVFLGPRPDSHEINHKNGNKADNRPENLEYVTSQENKQHAHEMGLYRGPKRQWAAKLTPDDIHEIRRLLAIKTNQYDIAKRFGVSQSIISGIKRGQSHKNII